jgi:integrase/recombinase XerD
MGVWCASASTGSARRSTYRDELPPRALPWPRVLRLLRSIDRTSPAGWRDLCSLHLIAYYGLRPSEVVALRP